MDNLGNIRTAIQDDLSIGDESTLFPTALIDRVINRAYRKAGGLYRWPQLEDAKKTSTQNGIEPYDYPSTWRSDSIWRIEVDSKQYGEDPDGSPLAFEDYLTWRRDDDNANSTDKKWANQKRRFFIYPVPTAAGTNNICVWGQFNVVALSADSDTTIFSYNMPECNEAVLLEALAILKAKGEDDKGGQFRSIEAKQILTVAFNKIRQEQNKFEKNLPMLHVTDFFRRRGGSGQNTGNFD